VCPCVQLSVAIWKYVNTGKLVNPCIITYTPIKSALLCLSSKDHSFRAFCQALYVMTLSSGNSLVHQCCTLSSTALSLLQWGLQASEQYSKWGITKLLYSCTMTVIFLCLIVWLIRPSILLALLHACWLWLATLRLLLTVIVMPRSLCSVTSFNIWPFMEYEYTRLLIYIVQWDPVVFEVCLSIRGQPNRPLHLLWKGMATKNDFWNELVKSKHAVLFRKYEVFN